MSEDVNTTEGAGEGQFPNALDNLTAEQAAVQEGIAALRKAHAIEREMLSRAIQSLCEITSRTPEDVISILQTGLDEDYEKAIGTATASAKVARLYLPGR